MPGITIDQARDLVNATLQRISDDPLQVTLAQSNYPAVQMLTEENVKYDGGKFITWDVTLSTSGNAKNTQLYGTDTTNVTNTTHEGHTHWTHSTTNFSYDVREILLNAGDRVKIFNVLKAKKVDAWSDMITLLENGFWSTPTSSTDALNPNGAPAWLTQGTNGSTGGFTGYSPHYAGGTTDFDAGGINTTSAINTRWANYYADHDGNIDDSLLDILSSAWRKCNFKAPAIASDVLNPKSDLSKVRFYSNDNVIKNLEKLARLSDDRIGNDLGKYQGATVYKGIPFIYSPNLDTADTNLYGTDPIFGINHNYLYPVVLRGQYFEVSKPINDKEQHQVLTVFVDLSYAYVCKNRRNAGFLINQQ